MVLGLIAAACGDDGNGGDGAGTGGDGEGTFSVFVGTDPSTLTPTDCTDSECQKVVQALFTGLIDYDNETSEPVDRMLESIESDDNTNWTITIEEGWTFHDGTPVTAQSYVDSWNYAANGENAQGGAYFFSRFAGYDELQCAETDDEGECVSPPEAEELTGLSAPDDTTIEVELSEPFSQFPLVIGYNVYYPMPEAFFDDPDAFNDAPIGNGPFQMVGEWQRDELIEVERYEDYAGDDEAQAAGIRFQIYSSQQTAYNDLRGGNLDVMDQIPPEELLNAEDDLGDRFIEREISSFTYLGFPTYDERFADPRLRRAFSMAIDREAIIDAIFNGAFTPASSVVSPVVVGSREDACEYCEYDPEAAAELLEEAGGFDGTLTLWFNSGAGHGEWVQALGNQLTQNLGVQIEYEEEDFAPYLERGGNRNFTGPFRLGWGMDYPSPQNYLEPLYTEASFGPGGSNYTFYSDPEVEELIAEGNAADDIDAAIESYHEAEDIILEDMPVIPLWFSRGFAGHSERVDGVVLNAFNNFDFTQISVTD
jgi:oligopeptide transport system substrate-binding protein